MEHSAEIPSQLNKREQIYLQMYRNYPQLKLDEPRPLAELNILTGGLPEFQQLRELALDEIPSKATFDEEGFREKTAVTTRLHDRYSPCFEHAHDFFEIVCVLKGSCTNYLAGEAQNYTAGDICIIAPHTRHAISAFSEEARILNILLRASTFQETFFSSFQGKNILSDFFRRALFTQEGSSHLFFSTGEDARLAALAEDIYRETSDGRRYADPISNALVSLFFYYLLRNHEQNLKVPNPTGKVSDRNIMFVLNYLIAHYKDVTLSGLSEFFGYSERQMARLLKDYTGESFTAILQKIRLERAGQLLQVPELSIPEVMEQVGYTNASHFYTLFKKKYGMTPAAYRETQKETERRPEHIIREP